MAFHMVHADRRNAPGEGQRLGAGGADQQRADQSGTGRVGDRVDVAGRALRLVQYLADQRQHALDVIARGQFRHHAAIHAVLLDLAEQRIGQQAALAVVERDTGFVAGGFQSQHSHGQKHSS